MVALSSLKLALVLTLRAWGRGGSQDLHAAGEEASTRIADWA